MALEAIGLQAILDDKNFQAGLKRYESGVSQMSKVTDGAAGILTRLGSVAGGAVVVGLGAASAAIGGLVAISKIGLDATRQWTEQLDALGDEFGMSGKVASSWAFLMNRVGLTVEEGAQGLNYFTRQLDDFGKTSKKGQVQVTPFLTALQKLGVSAYDTRGKLKTFDQIMPQIMDRFEKLPAGVNASALAMDLFGARGGSKFLDFLRQGSKGLDEARKKAYLFGLEMSTDEVDAAEQLDFSLNELNLGLLGFKNTIGRQVLPIAKDAIQWLNDNAIPPLVELAQKYAPLLSKALRTAGDWMGKFGIMARRAGDTFKKEGLGAAVKQFTTNLLALIGVEKNVATRTGEIAAAVAGAVQRIFQAFQKNGLGGAVNQLKTEIQKAWPEIQKQLATWGTGAWNWGAGIISQAPGQARAIAQAIGAEMSKQWPTISAQLSTWGTQFWGWLNNDVAPKVGANIALLANTLNTAIQQNWPTIATGLEYWKTQFWNWLTSSNGVLVSVSEEMVKLTDAIRAWTEAPETQKQLNAIGASVARSILDGLGQLFSDQKQGDNLLMTLMNNLWQAYRNNMQSLLNIPRAMGTGFWTEIFKQFTDPVQANQWATGLMNALTSAVQIVLQGLPGLVQRLVDYWNALIAAAHFEFPWNQSAPEQTGPASGTNGPAYAAGGWVSRTGFAKVHQGEYVIPAARASQIVNHNSRSIGNVSIHIDGGTSLTQAQLETAIYRGIDRVLSAA